MKRAAFTLIELVFSIVVVGVVILSIPLIVRQSNANTIESQNVIGFYNALTLMETIKNKPWDSNSVQDFENSGEYYILYTGNANTDCYKVANTNIWTKKGLGNANRRRMCDPDNKTASAIPTNFNNALNSINAFNNYTTGISAGDDAAKIVRFLLKSEVRYVDVNFGNGTNAGTITNAAGLSDLKEIKITLSKMKPDNTSEVVSTYVYYAANIGNNIPFSKDNQ